MEKKLKIVIIDSGFTKHKDIDCVFNGISICFGNSAIVVNNSIEDKIGHGTAITFLIHKHLPNSEIFQAVK
jgi:hypothetical protein